MNSKQKVECTQCGTSLMRRPLRPYDNAPIRNFFCDRTCKGRWQEAQRPVSNHWLRQKYIEEGLSANDIAKIVNRNSKRVWEWLKSAGIETRPRGADVRQHFVPGHRMNVGRVMPKEARQKIREARLKDGHYPKNSDGTPYWKDRTGPEHPTWKGGKTPERQAFYATPEWRGAAQYTYGRTKGYCERCGEKRKQMDIHHIVPFFVKSHRASISNLALLCKPCHRFVHSPKNLDCEFLPPIAWLPIHLPDGTMKKARIGPVHKLRTVTFPEWLKP